MCLFSACVLSRLSQCRVWHRGSVAKGMLMTDVQLPPGYIILPTSMVKVVGRRGCRLDRDACKSERSAFEVLRTSNRAVSARMNPQLVPLLEHAGGDRMVSLLIAMQKDHADRVVELASDTMTGNRLRNLLSELGLSSNCSAGVGPGEMLLAGFHPAQEPHLKKKVCAIVKDQLEQLASGRFAVPSAIALMGVPDFTGTLPAGTVCVIDGGKYCEEEILIYRNPGTHTGDVRKVRGVLPTPELRAAIGCVSAEMQNGLIFSTRGDRALADMCSGGDYDGDEFLIFKSSHKIDVADGTEPYSLVHAFAKESEPWAEPASSSSPAELGAAAPPPPAMVTEDAAVVNAQLQQDYLDLHAASGTIGGIAVVLQVAQEKCGAAHPRTNELVDMYNAALDAAKKGVKVPFPEAIKHELLYNPGHGCQIGYPCFMSTRAGDAPVLPSGSSNTALGKMWCTKDSYLPQVGEPLGDSDTERHAIPAGITVDVDLQVTLPSCSLCRAQFSPEVLPEHLRCCRRIRELERPGQPIPPDLAPSAAGGWGAVERAFHEKWTRLVDEYGKEVKELNASPGDSYGATIRRRRNEAWLQGYNVICDKYRHKLLDGYTEAERERPSEVLLCEAYHLYAIVYSRGRSDLAFAWNVAGAYLCFLKARSKGHTVRPGQPPRLTDPAMLQRVLSNARRCKSVPSKEVGDGGEREADVDDDFISTPWTRCG